MLRTTSSKSPAMSRWRSRRGWRLIMAGIDYAQVCFVIMPFGKKRVGDQEVDFDYIFREVFAPAIAATPLGDGAAGRLTPKRTDQDFFAGDISQEMFEYLEYSRFAIADISGLNPNVFYELGVRHRAQEVGTAVFRQVGLPIPFDINTVKAFDYEYQPIENIAKSRDLITRVLTESLRYNRLDSPVQRALLAQRARAATPAGASLDDVLRDAENAIRQQKWNEAIDAYRAAVRMDPRNCRLRLRLGLFLKDRGRCPRLSRNSPRRSTASRPIATDGGSAASPRTRRSSRTGARPAPRPVRGRFAKRSVSAPATTTPGPRSAAC